MPSDFRREDMGRRYTTKREEPPRNQPHRGRDAPPFRSGNDDRGYGGHGLVRRKVSRSRSPMLRLHHDQIKKDAQERGFYETYNHEKLGRERRSREMERRSPVVKSRIAPGPPPPPHRLLRMDEPIRNHQRSRSREGRPNGRRDERERGISSGNKRVASSSSVFVNLNRAVKRAREEKVANLWNKKVGEGDAAADSNRWGHSGFKELYPSDKRASHQKHRRSLSRSRSPQPPLRKAAPQHRGRIRSRSPRNLLPPKRSSPNRDSGVLKSIVAPKRSNTPPRGKSAGVKAPSRSDDGPFRRQSEIKVSGDGNLKKKREDPPPKGLIQARARPVSEIGNKTKHVEKSHPQSGRGGASGGGDRETIQKHTAKQIHQQNSTNSSSRPNSGKETRQEGRQKVTRNSSSSEFSSRTPSPQLKKKTEVKEPQRKIPGSKGRSSSSDSSSDEDVLEIHARDRPQSLSYSGNSSSDDDSFSDDSGSGGNKGDKSPLSSSPSEETSGEREKDRGPEASNHSSKAPHKSGSTLQKSVERTDNSGGGGANGKSSEKTTSKGDGPRSTTKSTSSASNRQDTNAAKTKGSASESESDSSSESDEEPRMTLSERFAKLTQMSRDKREFAKPEISISEIDTKLKVVKDLRNADTKVYVNQIQRPVSARSRPKSPDYKEGEMRYSADDRQRHFERMTRDEPMNRDRPDDWSDVRVRFNYYKSRGYFDERPLTLEEYGKWEAWWYEYRDWLAEEGYYDNQQQPPPPMNDYSGNMGGPVGVNMRREHKNWRSRDEPPPRLLNEPSRDHHRQQRNFQQMPRPEPLLAHPIRFGGGRRFDDGVQNRIPISRRIGHAPGGSLLVSIPPHQHQGPHNFRGGGRGRLAGRIGFRR